MDRKRAMLYPEVDVPLPSAPHNITGNPQTESGVATRPVEAPPSYDVAIAAIPATAATAAATAPTIIVNAQPIQQQQPHQSQQQQPQLERTFVPTAPINLGPNPCRVLCPACGAQKTTRMTHTANSRTHMAAALICLVGWMFCACFVPYCMNSCRTGNHYCRKCNTYLGVYNPKGVGSQ